MAANGARHIIFLSRSGQKKESARKVVRELEEGGTNVVSYACDISDEAQLNQALGEIALGMPPVAGVMQGALVLRVSSSSSLCFSCVIIKPSSRIVFSST